MPRAHASIIPSSRHAVLCNAMAQSKTLRMQIRSTKLSTNVHPHISIDRWHHKKARRAVASVVNFPPTTTTTTRAAAAAGVVV